MRANGTKLWGVIAVVGVLGGCSCNPPTECEDLFVSFDTPKDGAVGVPATTEVVVTVVNTAGTPLELDSAQLVTRASAATEFSVPREGTLTAGKASFSAVTLEPGSNVLKVTVKKKATSCTGTKTIRVDVPLSNDPPKVVSFVYPQDTAAPTGVLNSNELPLLGDLRVDLRTQFAIGGTAQLFNTATNAPIGPATPVSNSDLTIPVPATALADGAYSFFAQLTKGTLTNTQAGNPEAVKAITLARTAPTCAVALPTKAVIGPIDDADVAPGFQMRVSGTASSTATTIELKVSGLVPTGKQPLTAGGLTFDFPLPSSGLTTYTITTEAFDANGNGCVATRQVTANFVKPTVVITSPTAAGSPYNTFNIPLTATVTGADLGTIGFTTVIGAGPARDLGQFPVPVGGLVASAGPVAFVAGAQTVSAVATDAVGNVSDPATQAINVVGSGFSIVFTAPSASPALLTAASLTGGNYTFVVGTSAPAGTPVTFKKDGVAIGAPVNTIAGGSASLAVPMTAGTNTFRAEIGTPVNFAEVVVTVDLTPPVIIQPVALAGATTLNRAQDASESIAGAQRLLQFTAVLPTGGRTDICSNQTPAAPGAVPCADGAAGWWTLKQSATSPDSSFTFPEGTYSIKLVVVSGATAVASVPLSLFVDTIPPRVVSAAFVGDLAPLKFLNLAELAGLAPRLNVVVAAPDAAASIKSIVVRNTTGVVTPYNTATAFTGVVTLDQNITATEADYDWVVEVVDQANNANVLANPTAGNPLNTPAVLGAVRIDKVAPSCAVSQPASNPLGRPADVVPGTPAFDIDEVVTTSSDVNTIIYRVSKGQVINTTQTTVTGGTGTNRFTFTQTSGEVLYDFGASCTDRSGNSTEAAARVDVKVDLDPPTCALTAPTAAGSPYGTFNIPTSVTVGGAGTVGLAVSVLSSAAAAPIGSLTVAAGGVASGSVSYPSGTQTVTATVTDLAQNTCTTAPVAIEVNATGCAIAFTAPAIVSGTAYLTSAPFNVVGHSGNCGAGKTVTLFNVVGGVPTAIGTPQQTNASGDVTFAVTLAEGGPYTLRLQINNGAGVLTETDLTPVIVDTAPPTVGSVSPTGSALNFVAATNANLATAGYVADSSPGAPANFSVVATGIVGAVGGSVRVVFNSVVVASQSITTSPETVTLPVSLAHNVPGQFEVQIRDVAGNLIKPTDAPAVVDVIAPAAPAVTQSVSDSRAATAALSWSATFDDGSDSASGGHAGYDLRWSTSSVTGNNALALSTDYFDSTKANQEMLIPWSASAIARNLNLPPLNTYYISVRAKDEVGNYSDYVAPVPLANLSTVDALVNPTASANQGFGRAVAIGRLSGDAIDDLAVGASSANAVYVYFGRAGFGPLTTCAAPNCQTIALPGTSSGDNFGTSIGIGDLGDTVPSLVVTSYAFSSSLGRAYLFFGGTNPLVTTGFVEFRGATAGGQFGRSVQIIGDIDGDGLGEVIMAAPAESSGRGRVYIFKGRSKANWLLARTGNDGGTLFIPTSAATWTIEGPTPVPTNNFFGTLRAGFTSLGDVNGDGRADFALPCSRDTLNRSYLFSGSAVAAAVAPITTGDGATADQSLQRLIDSMFGATGSSLGFGAAASGGSDLIGGTGLDLMVGYPGRGRVSVFADALSSGAPYPGAPSVVVTGAAAAFFGVGVSSGDLNQDGKRDLVIAEVGAVTQLYSRTGSFDTAIGGFWQSRTVGGAGSSLGNSVATGDLDGDSKTDVVMGDNNASPGRVIVWH